MLTDPLVRRPTVIVPVLIVDTFNKDPVPVKKPIPLVEREPVLTDPPRTSPTVAVFATRLEITAVEVETESAPNTPPVALEKDSVLNVPHGSPLTLLIAATGIVTVSPSVDGSRFAAYTYENEESPVPVPVPGGSPLMSPTFNEYVDTSGFWMISGLLPQSISK